MSRVKRGITTKKRHKRLLKRIKGFRSVQGKVLRQGKQADLRAGQHAYRGRKLKKRQFRTLWNARINAAVRPHGMNYSRFIDALFKKSIVINRKMLSEIAFQYPEAFKDLVKKVKA